MARLHRDREGHRCRCRHHDIIWLMVVEVGVEQPATIEYSHSLEWKSEQH